MKIEVNYEVVEVVRYQIKRQFRTEGGEGWSMGFSDGDAFGEFKRKEDAEKVAAALETAASREARKGL